MTKARTLKVDEIILDLEDSVSPDRKQQALESAARALDELRDPRLSVRVNAPGSDWFERELMTLRTLSSPPRSIVLPKVSSDADVKLAEALLEGDTSDSGRARIMLQLLIETAHGLAEVQSLAAASARIDTLILGYADLAADLGRPATAHDAVDLWLPAQHDVLLAARRHGLQAVDGPYLGTDVGERFQASARRARDIGFDGKWAIHPSQVDPLTQFFTPEASELEHARAVVAALDGEQGESGVTTWNGQMLDEAVRRSAVRTLARAGINVAPPQRSR